MTVNTMDHETRLTWLEQQVQYGLSAKIDAMSWGIGQIHTSNEGIKLDIAGLRAGLVHLETSTHADMTALKATLDERASELREKIGTAEASLRSHIGRIQDKVTDRFDAVDLRFKSVDERFDGIDQRFNDIDLRFNDVDFRFDGIDQRLDAMDQRFDGIDKRLDGMDRRLDAMDKRLDGIDGKLDRLLAAAESAKG